MSDEPMDRQRSATVVLLTRWLYEFTMMPYAEYAAATRIALNGPSVSQSRNGGVVEIRGYQGTPGTTHFPPSG